MILVLSARPEGTFLVDARYQLTTGTYVTRCNDRCVVAYEQCTNATSDPYFCTGEIKTGVEIMLNAGCEKGCLLDHEIDPCRSISIERDDVDGPLVA